MPRVSETVEVGLPAASVFAYVADLSTTAEWDPGIAAARRLDGGELRVGSAFQLRAALPGAQPALRYEITAFEPPTRVTFELRHRVFRGRDEIQLDVRSPDHTRLVWNAQFGFAGDARLLDPLLTPWFRLMARRAVAGLRRHLHARAAAH